MTSLSYIESADPNTVISIGFSAGGHFSHILNIIHSATIHGVGNMQGAYYLIEDSFDSDLTAEELKNNSVA